MDTYSEAPHLQADRDTRTIVSGPPGIPEAVIITGQAWYDCYGNVVKVIGVPGEQAIASTPMAIQGQVTGDGRGHTVVAEGIETADQAGVSWCMEVCEGAIRPSTIFGYAVRTDSGRPASIMRLRTATPMAASALAGQAVPPQGNPLKTAA